MVLFLLLVTACVKKESSTETDVYIQNEVTLAEVFKEESTNESSDEYARIDLFNSVLEKSTENDIAYLGRTSDQLYYVVKNSEVTDVYSSYNFALYKVSYDFSSVTLCGEIKCDFIPREENAIYLIIPMSKYDIMEVMVYSKDSVYFYDMTGKLNRSYTVFGESEFSRNGKLDIKGDVSDWYVFYGMSLFLYRDDEGVKVFSGPEEKTILLTDAPVMSANWESDLQNYADKSFGKNVFLINNETFKDADIVSVNTDGGRILKVLYDDKRRTLLMMENEKGDVYYLRIIKENFKNGPQVIAVEISISTQSEERNMIVSAQTKLPSPHRSEDLQIRLKEVQDPVLERKILEIFSNAVFYEDDQDIIFTIDVEGVKKVEISKNSFKDLGYMLTEDIKVEYTGINMEYDMIRWNKDRTEKLLYMDVINDSYFAVELDFLNTKMDKEGIEKTITANIDYYRKSSKKPDIEYRWLDEKSLFVLVTNMEPGQDYCISLNGYISEDGSCHYSWESCHGFIGALEEYFGGIYDFTKSTVESFGFVEYDAKSQQETKFGAIDQYYDYIGPSAGSLVATAMENEWGYYAYIYDMDNGVSYDNKLFCTDYNDFFRYNKELYLLTDDTISGIYETGAMISVFESQKGNHIMTVRKNPLNDLFCVVVINDKDQFALEILDDKFNLIREVNIDYCRLGFYGMLLEPYWLNEDSIAITGSSERDDFKGYFVTKVYNVNSGETEKTIEHKKVMTVSPDGEFILMQDEDDGEKISIYDKSFELIGETEIDTKSDNPSYQFMDYWYEHILYLKYNDRNEIFKWNFDTNEVKVLELPYEKFIIDRVVDEDVFKLFLDVDILRRSNPF